MIRDILEEHLDDAAWLFERRQAALAEPDSTKQELAGLEERLRAHLVGFLLGGEASWELCRGALAGGGVGESFVAAILALETGDSDRRRELAAALASGRYELQEGAQWACRLSQSPGVMLFLESQAQSAEPVVGTWATHQLAWLTRTPEGGQERPTADPTLPRL